MIEDYGIWGVIMSIAVILFLIFLFMMMGKMVLEPNIEIQRVKQVDDGYYITINNEVYEYLEG